MSEQESDKQTEKKQPHRFKEGNPGGPGRPKGSKNKFTSLKDAWLNTFEAWGGEERLKEWLDESPHNERLFLQWLTKMLPANLNVDAQTHITYEVSEKFLPDVLKENEDE